MNEVKRYGICGFEGGVIELKDGHLVHVDDFDRVTAERDAALGRESALREYSNSQTEELQAISNACNAMYFEKCSEVVQRICAERDALQQRLTAADERADVLEAENRRLREDDLFYDAACEAMEGHQKERAKLGKEIGCQGSLIDGIAWIYQRLAELEKSPSGYTKQHHPVEFGPSDARRIGCSCGHTDPNHEAAKP